MSTKSKTPPKSEVKTATQSNAPEPKPKPRKPRRSRERREFPAKMKCEAILAIWSERRKPADICRELEIPWQQLQNWQNQALDAMMTRLSPRPSASEPPLNSRLQKLLDQTERKTARKSRLKQRLEDIQSSSPSPVQEKSPPKNPS